MDNTFDGYWGLLSGVMAGALLSAIYTWLFARQRLPASYRIAVIGFPQSGKTTLITALFAFLFRHGERGAAVIPRGDATIQRINSQMERLELGLPIGPTTDQDVFAYRAEVKGRSWLFPKRYKLEIGDFPGEDSVAFAEQFGDWLHQTKYFDWAISADAFLLVIDCGMVINDRDGTYVARQKSAFRAAWQRLQEHYLDGESDISRRPLILVFTKADLLIPQEEKEFDGRMRVTPITAEQRSAIDAAAGNMLNVFRDLREYFNHESRAFQRVFTTVVWTVEGEMLGIPRLASLVLPVPKLLYLPAQNKRPDMNKDRDAGLA